MNKLFAFVVISLSVSLVACDKAAMTLAGPAAEDLEVELENAPKVADPTLQSTELDLSRNYENTCLDPVNTTNAAELGYEVVVVIDKAADVQNFKVYHLGDLVMDVATSTGKELDEPIKTKLGNWTYQRTPVGFFTPTPGRLYGGLDENGEEIVYFSKSYEVDMPNAIFFYGGYAMHEATENSYKYLGSRASGGCIRLNKDSATTLFNLVKETAGMGEVISVGRNGCVETDSTGKAVTKKGYRTLIIIHDSTRD